MSDAAPAIWWVRRDLRLGDNPALTEALKAGGPVIPVFILDEVFESYGACPLWRFGLGVEHLAKTLEEAGSRLILRRGKAKDVLTALVNETGAKTVRWSRAYDPDQVARDKGVKAALEDAGVDAKSVAGHLMFEPWSVETKQGEFYKVYTPFWRSVKDRDVPAPVSRPSDLNPPQSWPDSEKLEDWALDAAMVRGADIVRPHLNIGEDAASARLAAFIAHRIDAYDEMRDFPGEDGTSRLSENLAWGEISPRACWHAGIRALNEGKKGAETFLKELVWREFAYHLVWHTPRIVSGNWREEWDAFPWNEDERKAEVKAWKQGRTGIRFVDAAMREMYVTGHMHNRARMIVASYLTKHLLCHWRIGQKWFEDCLIDWDPASNAMGWQWSAGSGPDATPYFRVFNPVTQIDKFDKDRTYLKRWLAEEYSRPTKTALSYFDAIPESWNMSPDDEYPEPIVPHDEGRKRALDAYENRDF
ncbi:deoxyribodipyrimidine photo-lyase [Alphaproteobacteria bacterium GH1-50]|uniref:Deoxyribodipyrimidine photo-lyase n=1 Tax=Kangsaoukella pontilimi TaxID=2691042 RepID=A0A7C9IEY6_9RHOB|nr:deoxyribodipyrimidine photo-lyase [Kangsaoukella pontilimi]MXQ07148.1 deoxyribodipyrimidine photo-lyase [Kangsaoukella pontilimi]